MIVRRPAAPDFHPQSPEAQRARKDLLDRSYLALRIIREAFPQEPCAQLMFAVVSRTVLDLNRFSSMGPLIGMPADLYLAGDMYHASLAGVDPEWVRDVLRRLGVIEVCLEQAA